MPVYSFLLRPAEGREHRYLIYHTVPEVIPNETIIIVLTDAHIASAGELFLESLRQLDNVVVLDTNTRGATLTSLVTSSLPNSRLRLGFGGNLRLPWDLVDNEGVGLLPDFWVHPDEALDLAEHEARIYAYGFGGTNYEGLLDVF